MRTFRRTDATRRGTIGCFATGFNIGAFTRMACATGRYTRYVGQAFAATGKINAIKIHICLIIFHKKHHFWHHVRAQLCC